ncbi:hypothetical protein OG393_20945 [Streptomyces sp. NBC_01216]|uniref:hypothetical protein n=1 Tax=Streptomyces sp. NBC_01216 TaxID=2903778 RepID=UPI002E0DF8B3|nr:hypothetical protein OG393_20945 [Streptomyces sp. NBC_01216]
MTILDELLVRIGVDSSAVDEGTDAVAGKLDGLAAPAAAAGLAAGAVFAVGISAAMDIDAAQSKLKDSLGLTQAEAERAGGIAGAVYSAGFGESLDGIADTVDAVVSSIGGLGKATDAELQQMAKGAEALAKRFEFDVTESMQGVGTLIKTGLAKDGVEALDLLTATAQKLPKAFREELPVLTKEYGEFFDQLGFTGPDMMGLLAEAAKNPLFEIDKVGDALKELSLRLADTDAVKEPLKALKLDVKDIQKLVNTGQGTKAFDQIITALKGVTDQTERTMLQAALFGGPGEDMGNTLLQLSADGAAAANGLDKTAGASKAMTDAMEKDPAQQMDAALRTLQMTLGEALLPLVKKASEFFSEHKEIVKTLAPIILGLAVALGIMAAVIWLVNLAMLANPIAWIILGIVALIAIVVILVAKWDWVKQQLGMLWDWISMKAHQVWDAISDYFSGLWDDITRTVREAIEAIKTKFMNFNPIGIIIKNWGQITGWVRTQWDTVTRTVRDAVRRIGSFFSGMWGGITHGLRSALNGAIGLINGAIGGINSLISGANRVPGVSIPHVPYIPYLADGGITTGPTLAMIGEGPEQEAVLPLSRLEQMISMGQGVRAPSTARVQPATARVVIDVTGGTDALIGVIQDWVRTDGYGDVTTLARR